MFYTVHELQRDQLVHLDYKQFCCSLCSKHCVVQHCRDVMITRDLTTCNLYAFVVVVPTNNNCPNEACLWMCHAAKKNDERW